MVIVAAALILQVTVGVLVYQKGANYNSFVNSMWSSASTQDRLAIQNEVSKLDEARRGEAKPK